MHCFWKNRLRAQSLDQFANNTTNRKLKKRDDADVEQMGKEHYFEMGASVSVC